MKTETKKLEEIIKDSFKMNNYLSLINEILPHNEIVAPYSLQEEPEESSFSTHIVGYSHVANYRTPEPDNKEIVILAIELKKNNYVENSRSIQRNYARRLIINKDADAAIIAFYTNGDESKWRLSLVRLDYEMQYSDGQLKVEENITPAKRYSFLVGKDEPSHTVIEQLDHLKTECGTQPPLNEIEDAFSVQKVSDEFFDLYRKKFYELKNQLKQSKDFIEESKKCGIDEDQFADQFAKKIMGQIVFLYFLQKKGWLGIKVWPESLTTEEYEKIFYSECENHGESKIIQKYLPQIYFKQNDEYKFNYFALDKIANKDSAEEIIVSHLPKDSAGNWGDGPKNYIRILFDISEQEGANFYNDFLEPLFYDTLNKDRKELNKYYSTRMHCKMPFLSGGIFEPINGYDWENSNFGISNEMFSNLTSKGEMDADGILDIFDSYNFTISEDEPMDCEIAIDPEMLGKIFEQLLDETVRKGEGAFYTPREIVHYMCQEELINYLVTKTKISEQSIRKFILYGDTMKDEDTTIVDKHQNNTLYIPDEIFKLDEKGKIMKNNLKEIDTALKEVCIVDPAVGSGAFPLGMLNEIVRARENLTEYIILSESISGATEFLIQSIRETRSVYTLKREAIKDSIFAADIDPSAVDITRLRLWLSLVIDDVIDSTSSGGPEDPSPLPNLECNILCGDSLIDEYKGVQLLSKSELIGTYQENEQYTLEKEPFEKIISKLIEAQFKLYSCKPDEKANTIKTINKLKLEAVEPQLFGVSPEIRKSYNEMISQNNISKPYILWQLEFAKIFKDKGGFDIVIGNPPYVDSTEMSKNMPKKREIYKKNYSCAQGNWDYFVLFIEKGLKLCKEEGSLSFIVPNKLLSAPYAEAIRNYMAKNQLVEIRDYSNVKVFKDQSVYPVVFHIKKANEKLPVTMEVMGEIGTISNHCVIQPEDFYCDTNWDRYFNSSQITLSIFKKMDKNPKLSSIATVNDAATTNQAYRIKNFLYDDDNKSEDTLKFINTGGIDRYKSNYGVKSIKYLNGKYIRPVVKRTNLSKMSLERLQESTSKKIIIGGMTKVLECYYDDCGEYLAGKSTFIVHNYTHLKYLLALLNSHLLTFYYTISYNSLSMNGGYYSIKANNLGDLPIAIPSDKIITEVEELVDEMIKLRNTKDEKDPEVVTLDEKIDNIVYSIYGLSQDEINEVKNN